MKTVRILPNPPANLGDNRPTVQANTVTQPTPTSSATASQLQSTYVAYVHSVIRDLLERESNPIERQNWMLQLTKGTKPETVPLCLIYSAEYRHLRVRRMFERTFKRPPTWDELRHWAEGPAANKSFELIWSAMLNSPEYTARNGQSNETFVRALFRDVLDRRPEAHEAEGWRGLLDAFAATRESLVEQFLHSKEYRTQMIRRWKETGLGRGPLPAETAEFVSKWEAGHPPEKLLAEILSSPEYFVRRLRRTLN